MGGTSAILGPLMTGPDLPSSGKRRGGVRTTHSAVIDFKSVLSQCYCT